MKRIISLGLGVQSTALYIQSSTGELPRADLAIFADTGKEGSGTYAYLEFLQKWQRKNGGIPIVVCNNKNLFRDLLHPSPGHSVSIPAFTLGQNGKRGMLRRQCTTEYKVQVISDYIRDAVYRLPKYSRRPVTAIWLGITTDEIERMSYPWESWRLNTYPFLGYYTGPKGCIEPLGWGRKADRQTLVRWFTLNSLPVPPKSACVFCPYQSDAAWAARKRDHPEDFTEAVKIDEALRDSTEKGIRSPVFLHSSCRPLREVAFDPEDRDESGECSGNCHL